MSRISQAFEKGNAFIGFLTAGDPSIDKTEEFILRMIEAGCDLVEIGIPFSDPIAEGEVIQNADIRALAAGCTTDDIFRLAGRLRKQTEVPLVLMTYLNPVFKYGYERFFTECERNGIDGIIVPDLPFEEKGELIQTANIHGVDLISMIAPTSKERIRAIARQAQGFLYVVSSMGVTGVRSEIKTDLNTILETVKEETNIPAAIGFGIHTPNQAAEYSLISDGVIVGSAIVRIIEQYKENAGHFIYEYVKSMKDAIIET